MFSLRRSICFFALAVLVASCSKSESGNGTDDAPVAVTIDAGILTRAYDTDWHHHDAIGVTMLSNDNSQIIDNGYNRHYRTKSAALGIFDPVTSNEILFFPQDGKHVNFKAYYPYDPAMAADHMVCFSVADQHELPAIDLMTADHDGEGPFSKESPDVKMRFNHRHVKLIFDIRRGDNNSDDIDMENVELSIGGMKTSGIYDVFNDAHDIDDGSDAEIRIPYRSGDDAHMRTAIVLPRDAGSGVRFDFDIPGVPDNGNFYVNLPADLELLSGHEYYFTIKLTKTGVLGMECTIKEWADGGKHEAKAAMSIEGTVGESADFFKGKNTYMYKTFGGATERIKYSYLQTDGVYSWKPDVVRYWDDLDATELATNGIQFTGIYFPDEDKVPSAVTSVVKWSVPAGQSAGYGDYDIYTAYQTTKKAANLKFEYTHAFAKATVKLIPGTGFSQSELNGAAVTLKNMYNNIEVDTKTGEVTSAPVTVSTPKVDVTPLMVTNGEEYNALVGPAKFDAGETIVVIALADSHLVLHECKVAASKKIEFYSGKETIVEITLNKTPIGMTATVKGWVEGDKGNIVID